jgi:putative transport protein
MDTFVTALREHQELAIFLTLALGFLIGRLKLGSFSLGVVVGTLLAGVAIGQLDIKVPPALGYTVPYAVGNILLTAWGPVIVARMR